MPTSVDRAQSAQIVPHATEYPPDRERQKQPFPKPDSDDGKNPGDRSGGAQGGPAEEDPAVLLDPEHHEDHLLDGVAAYTATAHKVLDPVFRGTGAKHTGRFETLQPASVVRHAYEDHGGEIEHHEVNLNT